MKQSASLLIHPPIQQVFLSLLLSFSFLLFLSGTSLLFHKNLVSRYYLAQIKPSPMARFFVLLSCCFVVVCFACLEM